ncbi:DDE_Tnp_IS1595 domain-containing protein [Caerostris extrusa]|uniref:DDE_Tnp_IS1595 domain-containing protein n=1 Tax=Caerostris extrusa TaxID=172846 RepID=A0AAV4WWI9_CAEEX|nr:DDE_Tnp_IS1595 domain-containing protein [Caerostris extrusa]
MHPSLYYFSCYSWHTLLESEETTIKFMQEVGLIPSMSSPCPVCGAETRVNQTPEKIRFPLRLLDTPEDREGLFLLGRWEEEKGPVAPCKKYVHPMTAVICTYTAAQYKKIDRLIPGVIHKTINHSKGEFVTKDDKSNTINPLENENKYLKRFLISRVSKKSLASYMALHYYRRAPLDPIGRSNYGAQV